MNNTNNLNLVNFIKSISSENIQDFYSKQYDVYIAIKTIDIMKSKLDSLSYKYFFKHSTELVNNKLLDKFPFVYYDKNFEAQTDFEMYNLYKSKEVNIKQLYNDFICFFYHNKS